MDILKEFSSDDILRETIHSGIVGHDGKPEECIGSGVDREVLGDFIYVFIWRSGLDRVQNIVWNWQVKSLTAYVENGGVFWHLDVESGSNIKQIVDQDYKKIH